MTHLYAQLISELSTEISCFQEHFLIKSVAINRAISALSGWIRSRQRSTNSDYMYHFIKHIEQYIFRSKIKNTAEIKIIELMLLVNPKAIPFKSKKKPTSKDEVSGSGHH